jgi:hypothetical protein
MPGRDNLHIDNAHRERNMQWIITKDHISDGQVGTGRYDNRNSPLVAIRDPLRRRDAVDQFITLHSERFNFEFQLLDDDAELYYTGRCVDLHDAIQETAFEPLDWAEGHAGCTTMQYRKVGDTKWETL